MKPDGGPVFAVGSIVEGGPQPLRVIRIVSYDLAESRLQIKIETALLQALNSELASSHEQITDACQKLILITVAHCVVDFRDSPHDTPVALECEVQRTLPAGSGLRALAND